MRGSSIEIDKCAFVHLFIFRCTTQGKNPDLPPIWCAFVHLQMHKCTSRSLVEFSPEPVMTRKTSGRKKKKKEASRFIINTKPASERILTQNTGMQAENPTNERQAKAAEAEGPGNSNAAVEARNNKQQMENFVDAEFPTPPICWTER